MDFADILLRELYEAYYLARTGGKRKTFDEHRFEVNDFGNLVHLRDSILARAYRPSRGVAFIVHDPVTREIIASPFVDRVVHHLLFKYADMWWGPRLLPCSYSCRKGKGTLYGIKDLQHKIRRVSQDGRIPTVVVQRDLRGYFINLLHSRIFTRVKWGLDQQFKTGGELYRTLKFLWKEVIFDTPTKDVQIRGRRSDWDDLPIDKTLIAQPEGRGLIIGSLTSQEVSNLYLDQLDRFVVIEQGIKNYGRYVDDFFFVIPAAELDEFLREKMPLIEKFAESLAVIIHPLKQFETPIEQGINFLGAKVFHDHIVPGPRISQNFASAMYALETGGIGKLESITSYDGHLAHFDSYKLIARLFDNLGWDYPYPKL